MELPFTAGYDPEGGDYYASSSSSSSSASSSGGSDKDKTDTSTSSSADTSSSSSDKPESEAKTEPSGDKKDSAEKNDSKKDKLMGGDTTGGGPGGFAGWVHGLFNRDGGSQEGRPEYAGHRPPGSVSQPGRGGDNSGGNVPGPSASSAGVGAGFTEPTPSGRVSPRDMTGQPGLSDEGPGFERRFAPFEANQPAVNPDDR